MMKRRRGLRSEDADWKSGEALEESTAGPAKLGGGRTVRGATANLKRRRGQIDTSCGSMRPGVGAGLCDAGWVEQGGLSGREASAGNDGGGGFRTGLVVA
ncbi:hypothetical protein M0R45_002035 [Rubus argutus]|uniref:Uncharacterized protein n=1 Tax=Rubus argutus TaxID=59490 RepID=A0AAW1VHQ8_RUBAR